MLLSSVRQRLVRRAPSGQLGRAGATGYAVPMLAKTLSALCALAALLACAGEPPKPPHIVLFTVDTLRADHLSFSGYPRATSPNVDAFAEGAWHFEQALTVIPKTGPSFATLLTGRHPREHGVTSNFSQIPRAFPMLAERLQQAGYRTAAFVENPAVRATKGFDRGFDVYEVVLSGKPGTKRLVDAYLAWAAANWDRPTFVWIHTLDPHGPYRPPPAYEQLFIDDEWARSDERVPFAQGSAADTLKVLGAVPSYQQRSEGDDRVADYVARYDAEIRLVDDAFGRVMEDLRARGLYDDAVVIFTADHGESLGEHDYYFEHGWFAYEPGLHIPLLVKTPGQQNGQRVSQPVSNLDFFRTVSALAGSEVPPEVHGRNLLDGPVPERTILVENSDRYVEKYFGLRSAGEKFLVREQDGREELYDLEADPGETRNLAEERPEAVRALRAQLDRQLAELGHAAVAPAKPVQDDADTIERLRELGYVE